MSGFCPIYRARAEPQYSAQCNAGLWYDKFCDQWSEGWDDEGWKGLGDDGKRSWIRKVASGPVGNPSLLKEAADRRRELLEGCSGSTVYLRTGGPFVTGLGRNHPVENGFSWNHTLGVPYLPGSSVKGVVRSWAKTWLALPEEEVKRIFGPRGSKDASTGSVVFLEALPIRPVQLKAEIMTPHYGPYYQGKEAPGDWHSPVPIPFLVVEAGQEFQFGILPRRSERKEDVDDCRRVQTWLVEALQNIGAGAKTASGYGRFELFTPKTPGSDWLERFASSQKKPLPEVMKSMHSVLAREWSAIADPNLKAEVMGEIEKRYREMGWWDSPPAKGMKRSKQVYLSGGQTEP